MGNAGQLEDDGVITAAEAETVLGTLCVKYGFCLPPLGHARLRDCRPSPLRSITDTVFHAEGLDPRTADRSMYKAILEEVRAAFGHAVRQLAGLPPNPSLERTRGG